MAEGKDKQEHKHPGGRPLKYQTVEELDRAIQNYFSEQDPHETKALAETGRDSKGNLLYDTRNVLTEQKPYTMSGLARTLGISRQTLLDYSDRDEFLDSLRAAKQKCEEYAESQLFGPYSNGAKFNLTNNYSGKYTPWTDKTAVDHTTKDQPIPLLAGLAPAKLEVEDEDAAGSDDSSSED